MLLNEQNFQKKLDNNKVILVDFWAEWCGPCRVLGPIIEDVANLFPNNVGKMNVDENRKLASQYSVRSIPTVIFFKNGEPIERVVGIRSKNDYIDKLKYYLN